MDAIEAVVELAKERDELADELETYESWFESLVGKHVILATGSRKHRRFVECVVNDFVEGEGWELESLEEDGEVHIVTFEDFVKGKVYVRDEKASKKKVTFDLDEDAE